MNATLLVQDVCSKKNGESFQVPWYFELQKKERSNLKRKVERLDWLNPEDVTGVSQENFGRVSGQIGLSEK